MDDFDDAFFDSEPPCEEKDSEGGDGNGSREGCGRGGEGGEVKGKKGENKDGRGEDDAISIGSSSSSSSSGSDSSSDSASSSDDDTFVESLAKKNKGNDRGKKKVGKGKVDARAAIRSSNDSPKKVSASRSTDNGKSNVAPGDDGADDLDADLDDDDLVEFFSQSPKPVDSAPKKSAQEYAKSDEEAYAKETTDEYDFDSLDDDDLAELEEFDVVDGGKGSNAIDNKEDTSSGSVAKRNFTISYNGEKKECPAEEDLVDSDDDEVVGAGSTTNKENSSPNKKPKKSNGSSYFEKRSSSQEEEEDADDEFLELFGNNDNEATLSPKKSPPGSPSSLDTPRENPNSSSSRTPTRSIAFKRDATEKDIDRKSINPYRTNPYQSAKKNAIKHTTLENKQVPPGGSNNSAINTNHSTRDDTSGVVALPDIVLSPNAQQSSELRRLGIDHSHFKPPPYTPSPDPIVHKLNSQNRPQHTRRNVAVDQIFSSPMKNMWKAKFAKFNHVQSEMVNVLANSDDNVIVSAPTGAGKTALFEMAMARLFASNFTGRHVGGVSKARKVVYIAPNKALCEERQDDWSKRLTQIDSGIVCTTITGDVNSSSAYSEIAQAHLILTTPEKWDSITRKWNDQFVLLSSIKLVLVDEVHMIGERDRGGCLESIIMRMKTIQRGACAKTLTCSEIASSSYTNTTPEALMSNMRIVAVSATLPNLGQLASFVESGEAYVFDQSFRPVPLSVYVQSCGNIRGGNRYLFDKSLNQQVPSILNRFSSGRPAIVFCHSKRETEQLAEELTRSNASQSRANEPALINFSGKTDNASLQRCIRKGLAFHHAGLDASDRRLVEEAFGSGAVKVLCATSTLAMGVNLPSHLVVIKGTAAYRGKAEGHQDIDAGTLLQMMGRAGRPGFDKSGTAVIMTDAHSKTRYENVSQGLKVVESHLMDDHKLTEVLNIEISQGVITSPEEAADWVKGTFLYRRIQCHPLFYSFKGKGIDALHSFILDKCTNSIDNLRKIRAIIVKEDGTFSPDAGCHIMSRNFVDYETMKSVVKLPHDSGPVQLLHMMANCAKVQIEIRRNEKKPLNEAYKLIKYKLEGPQSKIRIQTPAEKAFVMLQAAIGQHYFQDGALRRQMSNMIDGATQILSAVEQYAKEGSGHGQVATHGMLFRRSIYSSLWGEHDGVLNQIGGVTQEMTSKLKAIGISTFADAVNSSDHDIARACNVTESFASSLRTAASKILHRTLKLSACSKETGGGGLEVLIKLERRVAGVSGETGERVVSYSLLVFTDRPGGLLHYSEDITKECEMKVQCPEKFGRAYIRLVSNLVGLDEQVTVDGNDRIQKSSFSLSPNVAKSSATKGKKQSKLTQPPLAASRKRLSDSHRDSVSKVSDMRLHKRGKTQNEQDDDCIIIDDAAVDYVTKPSNVTKKSRGVTPSPHPQTKNLTPVRTSYSTQRSQNTSRSHPPNSSARRSNSSWSKNTNGPRNVSSKWIQEKRTQKTDQQTAFNSPKENPFASYSFDPNNIENSLNSNADRSKQVPVEQSILPRNLANSAFSTKKPQYGQSFRTPANRRKGTAASGRISSVGLLQQKAAELQQHHSQTTASQNYTNRGAMQHNMAEAPSVAPFVHNNLGYPANDGRMSQYGESLHEPNQFMGPGPMAQSSYFQRPGTSAGSVMQQSFGMVAEPSISPPPTFMGRSNNDVQNNNYMRGPMAGVARPMSSAGQSIASRLRGNNLAQANYGASMPQYQQFPGHSFQPQKHFHSQHDFQPQMHDFESFHGSGAPYENNPGFQHGMSQQQQQQPFDDTFNDPLCHGLDPTYGNVDNGGMSSFHEPSFGGGGMHMHAHGPLLLQSQFQPQLGDGHQFGGYQQSAPPQQQQMVRNPYNPYEQPAPQQQQQQQDLASNGGMAMLRNPYKQPQQQQNFRSNNGMPNNDEPPMQEVVVQNNSVRSGLAGDDTSQFDDAFL